MTPTTDYLSGILARKRDEVARLRRWAGELERRAAEAAPARPWATALRRSDRVALIAEVKRQAPSSGVLNAELDPVARADAYARGGASAISVLTDRDFAGNLEDLTAVRARTDLPVLRKDFIIDPLQVWETRAAGGDAVLLIVRALEDARLGELLAAADDAGVGTLVEVHDADELDRALAADAPVIGINNRDLTTFQVDLEVTRRLAGRVPGDRILVAESGIGGPEQVRELGGRGVDAVLVGQALVTHSNPSELARSLAGQPRMDRTA